MCNLLNFDIQARGVKSLLENWKHDHDQVKNSVWPLEELVDKLSGAIESAFTIYDQYRLAKLDDAPPYGYFILCFEMIASASRDALAEAEKIEPEYQGGVAGLDRLRELLPKLIAIIDEDRFATDSAFAYGALD